MNYAIPKAEIVYLNVLRIDGESDDCIKTGCCSLENIQDDDNGWIEMGFSRKYNPATNDESTFFIDFTPDQAKEFHEWLGYLLHEMGTIDA